MNQKQIIFIISYIVLSFILLNGCAEERSDISQISSNIRQHSIAQTEITPEAETLYQQAYQNLFGSCIDCNLIDVKRWLEQADELEHPEATYLLGQMYIEGLGVAKDYEKAVTLFDISARTGNPKAQAYLGIAYYQQYVERLLESTLRGDNINQTTEMLEEQAQENMQNAIEELVLLADEGDVEAMYLLARTLTGMSGRKDEVLMRNYVDSAMERLNQSWTTKSGNQAHIAYQIGMLYAYEPADSNEGMKWLTKAADLGCVQAELQLGYNYYIDEEYNTALTYLERAAQKEHVEAQFFIGNHSNILDKYREDNDSHNGLYWFEKAAKLETALFLLFRADFYLLKASNPAYRQIFFETCLKRLITNISPELLDLCHSRLHIYGDIYNDVKDKKHNIFSEEFLSFSYTWLISAIRLCKDDYSLMAKERNIPLSLTAIADYPIIAAIQELDIRYMNQFSDYMNTFLD